VGAVRDVVVGVDDTMTSWRAFSLALSMAKVYDARLHACFVFHVPATAELPPFALPVAGLADDADGGKLGAEVRGEMTRAGVDGDFSCRDGDVALELEELAETCRADMIIVGRSRHPTLHLGGVPRRLLSRGRRAVLVVP
jgi:nucleotide-binding universal stress UspA family protein